MMELLLSFAVDPGIDLPPHKVCRSLPAKGQFAREGKLSFVEQGSESKRPGNEAHLSALANQTGTTHQQ